MLLLKFKQNICLQNGASDKNNSAKLTYVRTPFFGGVGVSELLTVDYVLGSIHRSNPAKNKLSFAKIPKLLKTRHSTRYNVCLINNHAKLILKLFVSFLPAQAGDPFF